MPNETYKVKFLKPESKNGHIYYTIKVIGSKTNFYIRDRYSSMRDYWKNMVNEHDDAVPPNFPGKKWFGNTDEEFIKQRRIDLEHFFNSLLGDPKLAGSPITKAYFKQKKITFNEKKSPRNGKNDEREEIKAGYVNTENRLLHEKKWRKVADDVTKEYIDINLGDDPPLPEEVKKKAIKYAESINETLSTIPYVSKILDISKRNSELIDTPILDLIKKEKATNEWLGEKMKTLMKIMNNEESSLYAKEEFIVFTRVKKPS